MSWKKTRQRNATTNYIGVYKVKDRWKATICIDGKSIHLGMADTEEEALKIRQFGEIKYFGEIKTNKGEGVYK